MTILTCPVEREDANTLEILSTYINVARLLPCLTTRKNSLEDDKDVN